jgi:DNA-binding protein YbaB
MKKKKYRLRPWVKVTLVMMIGVAIISQMFKVFDAGASEEGEKKIFQRDALHGVVEITINGKAELTIIEEDLGVASVSVEDKGYIEGDIVTVVYDNKGKIINAYKSSEKEIKYLRENYGATYRMLLEKHGRYKAEE